MDYERIIMIEPDKRAGSLAFASQDHRVRRARLPRIGMTEQQILATSGPDREDIRACLAFAADRERRLIDARE